MLGLSHHPHEQSITLARCIRFPHRFLLSSTQKSRLCHFSSMSVIIPSPTYPPRTYDGRRLGLQFTPVSPTLPTISPPEPSPPAMIEDDKNLFDGSIRENIAYGAAMWSGYRACRACSHVHDFVLGLLQRYITSVGENRSLLSGGQGQAQHIPIAQEDIDGACEWGSDIIFVSSSSWSSAYLFFHFDPNNTFAVF